MPTETPNAYNEFKRLAHAENQRLLQERRDQEIADREAQHQRIENTQTLQDGIDAMPRERQDPRTGVTTQGNVFVFPDKPRGGRLQVKGEMLRNTVTGETYQAYRDGQLDEGVEGEEIGGPENPVSDMRLRELVLGETAKPDQAARDAELAARLGRNRVEIETDREGAELEDRLHAVEALKPLAPRTYDALHDPSLYAVAHDDTDILAFFEHAAKSISDQVTKSEFSGKKLGGAGKAMFPAFGASILRAEDMAAQGLIEGGRLLENIYGQDYQYSMAKGLQALGAAWRDGLDLQENARALDAMAARMRPEGKTELERGIYSGIESFGASMAGIATGLVTRNPELGLSVIGATAGGQAFGDAQEAGLPYWKSLLHASEVGTFEVGTELLPMKWLIGDITNGTPFGKMLAKQLAAENVGEQAATITQDMADWVNIHPEGTLSEYLAERPSAALETAVATTFMAGLQTSVTAGLGKGLEKLDAEQREARAAQLGSTLAGIAGAAQDSKLLKRAPEKFREGVKAGVAGTDMEAVRIAPEAVAELAQSEGVQLDQLAQAFRLDPEELQASIDAGADIIVPTGDYAAAVGTTRDGIDGPAIHKALERHMRFRVDDPTAAQMEVMKAAFEEEQKAQQEIVTKLEAFADAEDRVIAKAVKQAQEAAAAVGVDQRAAWAAGTLRGSMAATLAARTGEDADKLFDTMFGRIEAAGDRKPGDLEQELGQARPAYRVDDETLMHAAEALTPGEFEAFKAASRGLTNEQVAAEIGGDDTTPESIKVLLAKARAKGFDIPAAPKGPARSSQTQRTITLLAEGLGHAQIAERVYGEREPVAGARAVSRVAFKHKDEIAAKRSAKDLAQSRRGAFSRAGGERLIRLFDGADLSTLLHEGAHEYLDVIWEMSRHEGAHPFVTDMLAEILKWHGLPADWNNMFDEAGNWTTESKKLHEAFAETFEAWFAKGEAPTVGLREAFRTIWRWMRAIYHRLSIGRRVNLTPEIEEVFRRAIAADDAIAAVTASDQRTSEALIQEWLDAGKLKESEAKRLRVSAARALAEAQDEFRTRLIDDYLRTERAAWRKEAAEVRAEVERVVDTTPEMRVWQMLSGKGWMGETEVWSEEKIDRELAQEGQAAADAVMAQDEAALIDRQLAAIPSEDTDSPAARRLRARRNELQATLAAQQEEVTALQSELQALWDERVGMQKAHAAGTLANDEATQRRSADLNIRSAQIVRRLRALGRKGADITQPKGMFLYQGEWQTDIGKYLDLNATPQSAFSMWEKMLRDGRNPIIRLFRRDDGSVIAFNGDEFTHDQARDLLGLGDQHLEHGMYQRPMQSFVDQWWYDASGVKESVAPIRELGQFDSATYRMWDPDRPAWMPGAWTVALAQQMETDGADANAIWQRTGLARTLSGGDWIFSIPGVPTMRQAPERKHRMELLGDLVDWPELYELFPNFRKIEVTFGIGAVNGEFNPNARWEFNANGKLIIIAGIKASGPADRIANVIKHEIQHAIQAQHQSRWRFAGANMNLATKHPKYQAMVQDVITGKLGDILSEHRDHIAQVLRARSAEVQNLSDSRRAGDADGVTHSRRIIDLANQAIQLMAEASVSETLYKLEEGEVQARKAEGWSDLSEEQKATVSPSSNLDVDRDKVWAFFDVFDTQGRPVANNSASRVEGAASSLSQSLSGEDDRGAGRDVAGGTAATGESAQLGDMGGSIATSPPGFELETIYDRPTSYVAQSRMPNSPGWGPVALPPHLPPMSLDLEAVRNEYGEEAARNVPPEVRAHASSASDVESYLQLARDVKRALSLKEPKSLWEFLATKRRVGAGDDAVSYVGVQDPDGEIAAMVGRRSEAPGLIADPAKDSKKVRSYTLDAAAIAAWEAGYFQGPDPPTPNQLLDALRLDVAYGQPQYRPADAGIVSQIRNAERWAAWFSETDIDIKAPVEALRARLTEVLSSEAKSAVGPNHAAELFGLKDGKAVLKALEAGANREEIIRNEVELRMWERHGGDPFRNGELLRKAEEYAANEAKVRWVEIEMNALAKVTGRTVEARAAKLAARERLMAMPVKEVLRPDQWLALEQKWGRLSYEAARKGDLDKATDYQRYRLINLHLYKEAVKLGEKVEKARSAMVDYGGKTKQARLYAAGADYAGQMNGLLADYNLKKGKPSGPERAAARAAWIEARKGEMDPYAAFADDTKSETEKMIAAEEAIERSRLASYLAAGLAAKDWRSLDVEGLLGLKDEADIIWKLATQRNKLLREGERRRLTLAANDIADSIRMNQPKVLPKEARESDLPGEKQKRGIKSYLAMHRTLQSYARQMDGERDGGLVQRYLVRPLNEAFAKLSGLRRQMGKDVEKLFSAYSKQEMGQFFKDRQFIVAIGESLTKQGRLAVALNWGNEKNRRRLMDSTGWDEAQVGAILATLDKRDWDFIQSVWDYLDAWFPDADRVHKAVHLSPMAKEEALPVVTRFGVYKGGYYPIKFDGNLSSRADQRALEADGKAQAGKVGARKREGFTKKRVKGRVTLPLKLSVFDVIVQHLDEVATSIATEEAMLDVGRIAVHPDFEKAVTERYGRHVHKEIVNALRTTKAGMDQGRDVFSRFINWTRNGATIVGLGLNVSTALLQPLGVTNSIVRVGGKWMLKGYAKMGGGPARLDRAAKFIMGKSAFMRHRRDAQSPEISAMRAKIKPGLTPHWVTQGAFWMLANAQFYAVDMPTWLGQFEKSTKHGRSEEDAIAEADQAVIDSQGGGEIHQIAGIQRGGPILRLFTNFMSYMLTTWNLTVQRTRNTDFRSPREVVQLGMDYLLMLAVPVAGKMALDAVIAGARGDDDDDKDWLETYVREQGVFLLSPFIGVSQVAGAVRGEDAYPYRGPAGLGFFQEVSAAGATAWQGDFDESFWRPANKAAGMVFHYPAAQLDRTTRGALALWNGESDNPAVLFFGPPPKK